MVWNVYEKNKYLPKRPNSVLYTVLRIIYYFYNQKVRIIYVGLIYVLYSLFKYNKKPSILVFEIRYLKR
jgi:hypothetical protein